jgi:hypothetical protein
LIIYRKSAPLRIRRSAVPAHPWWFATAIAPYGPRRATPLTIDYLDLRATSADRMEVSVAGDVRDDLERLSTRLEPPVLIDAAEFAEVVFRRGEQALEVMREWELPATMVVSTRGETGRSRADMTVLVAWPVEMDRIEAHAAILEGRPWGLAVPVMFPVTTDLALLERLSAVAAARGATFLSALPIDIDATAKQAMAQSLTLPDDEEIYQHLFHADLEPVHVATERHIAALAADGDMRDFVVPPRWDEKTNWNAAVVLMLAATRMLAMESDTELAGTIARSARVVAELDKPLARIAAAASLSIVEALDEVSIDILTEWIERGTSAFADRVNARWRLRRDAGV